MRASSFRKRDFHPDDGCENAAGEARNQRGMNGGFILIVDVRAMLE